MSGVQAGTSIGVVELGIAGMTHCIGGSGPVFGVGSQAAIVRAHRAAAFEATLRA
jgi:hypothetical protein